MHRIESFFEGTKVATEGTQTTDDGNEEVHYYL